MARKRIKQYLMLLTVIGVVAVAASGPGTFSSFNAEVANPGNYFATGSLVLNDNGGTTTCTSAADSGNLNTAGTGCDTLFTLSKLSMPHALLTTALTSGNPVTQLNFTGGLQNAAIDNGDTITVSDGANSDTFTAAGGADVGATSVAVTSHAPSHSYAGNGSVTVSDGSATYYAKLTLTNAGTLNASGISFSVPSCTPGAQEGTGTLTTSLTLGTAYTSLAVSGGVSGTFSSGDPVVITDGVGDTQTFIASANVANTATSIPVVSQKANFSYPANTTTISGPVFGSGDLCATLKLSIVETDALFRHDSTNNALGCAYGQLDNSVGLGCSLTNGNLLNALPTTGSPYSLSLASGGGTGNGTTGLDASGIRYFLIAVKEPGTSLNNTYQNRKATLDLRWQIAQA